MFLALFLAAFAVALGLDLAGTRTGWLTVLMATGLASLLLWAVFPGWPPKLRGWR